MPRVAGAGQPIEPCRSPHGWTLDTLEFHLSARIAEYEERNKERLAAMRENINLALASADKAIAKAELATDRRFDSVNEFRATLSDQATQFLSRDEYASRHETIVAAEQAVESRLARIENRTEGKKEGLSSLGSLLFGAIASIAALASIIAIFEAIYR